jgi:hypothetical protein
MANTRNHVQRLIALTTVLGVASLSNAKAEDLFTTLNADRLFTALELEKRHEPGLVLTGFQYLSVGTGGLKIQLHSINLAVHGSVAEAKVNLRRLVMSLSVGPNPREQRGQDLGDERWFWVREDRCSATAFRRGNVTVALYGATEFDKALALAREIDNLIQSDRDVAPLGQFAEQPQFVTLGAPAQLKAEKSYEAEPIVRGLGPPEKIQIRVEHGGEVYSQKENAKLTLRCLPNRIPNEAGELVEQFGPLPVLAIAGNPETNVFVARQMQVVVVPP